MPGLNCIISLYLLRSKQNTFRELRDSPATGPCSTLLKSTGEMHTYYGGTLIHYETYRPRPRPGQSGGDMLQMHNQGCDALGPTTTIPSSLPIYASPESSPLSRPFEVSCFSLLHIVECEDAPLPTTEKQQPIAQLLVKPMHTIHPIPYRQHSSSCL